MTHFWTPYTLQTASSRFHLYMFFGRAFVVPLLNPLFDPSTPFLGIPLYMAHPIPVPPHQAPPPTTPPQPAHPASFDSDPSEWMEFSSSSSSTPSDSPAPTDPRSAGVILNGFLSSEFG